MILLTLTLGSRNYFSRRALIPEDHLLRQKILRISLDIFPRPLCSSPSQSTVTDISLWVSACTCHSLDHSSSLLLLQDASRYSLLSRESFEFTVLQFYFAWKPLRFFSPHLSRIRSSQLFMCLTKFFGILFDLSKILCSLLFLKFLPACIMVNSIWLVVLDNIPCLSHFEPIDSICVYARSHQIILLKFSSRLRRHSGHELVLGNSNLYWLSN